MERFVVVIEETVAGEFEVFADSAQEALDIAEIKYNKGEFVLEPGELQNKMISIKK